MAEQIHGTQQVHLRGYKNNKTLHEEGPCQIHHALLALQEGSQPETNAVSYIQASTQTLKKPLTAGM